MESITSLKQDEVKKAREASLINWLSDYFSSNISFSMQAMQGDASFRRYFRIFTPTMTYVAMDAPPPLESCVAFVAIAKELRDQGLNAPEIIHADIENGFLLLSDFGDTTYLKALDEKNADGFYQEALKTLLTLQKCQHIPNHVLPVFNQAFMLQEWAWHKDWFLRQFLHLEYEEESLDQVYDLLIQKITSQPYVLMHRDYHSANLMVLFNNEVGILDFQDAFIGPITYDLASLLRDCYINWPNEKVLTWVKNFFYELKAHNQLPHISEETFIVWFDYMSVQRHLKALLTFARKAVRDQDASYIKHIPRTLNYLILETKAYPELKPLHEFLEHKVIPAFKRLHPCVP